MIMLKNNRNILIVAAVVAVLLIAGGVFLLLGKKSAPAPLALQQEQQVIPTIAASDIGLSLAMSADGKKVVMQISKTAGLSSVDYELSYTSKGDIPRGAIGHVDVKLGQAIKQEITLGTCSDVCHYDQEVSNIKLVLKVTKTDNNVYQVEQSLQ